MRLWRMKTASGCSISSKAAKFASATCKGFCKRINLKFPVIWPIYGEPVWWKLAVTENGRIID